jgi:hypothetical protein
MKTERLFGMRIPDAYHAAWTGSDTFVVATSVDGLQQPEVPYQSHLLWYKLTKTGTEVVAKSAYDGRIMAVFPVQGNRAVAVHWEADINRDYRIHVFTDSGSRRVEYPIRYSGIYQLSSTVRDSFIAAFGADMPGYPTDSSIIETSSGTSIRLPYSACAICDDEFFFVSQEHLKRQSLHAGAFGDGAEASSISDAPVPHWIISILPGQEGVLLVSGDAVFDATPGCVKVVHKWKKNVVRVVKCGHTCFARSVGPVVETWNEDSRQCSDIVSSSGKNLLGFDAIVHSDTRMDEGQVMLVSESGVVDGYAWSANL